MIDKRMKQLLEPVFGERVDDVIEIIDKAESSYQEFRLGDKNQYILAYLNGYAEGMCEGHEKALALFKEGMEEQKRIWRIYHGDE